MLRLILHLIVLITALGKVNSQSDTALIGKIFRQAQIEVDALEFDKARYSTQSLLRILTGRDSFSISTKIKTLNLEATMAYHESDYEKAAEMYNKALQISKAHFPMYSYENAWAYYQMAWIHEQGFEMDAWADYLDTTAVLFQKVYPIDDCRHGLIWQHRARMNYYSFGPADTTLTFLNKAFKIFKECSRSSERSLYDLYKIYYDVFLSSRQFDSAGHYLNMQIEFIKTQKGALWDIQRAWKELSKAHLYRMDGDYEKALIHYQYAEALFEKIPEQDTVPLITAKLYGALSLSGMARNHEAIAQFKKLLGLKDAYAGLTYDVEGLILEGAAHAYAALGKCDSSVLHARQALKAFYNVVPRESPKLLRLYITYANCLSKLSQHKKADSVFLMAITSSEKLFQKENPLKIHIRIEQASAAIRQGDFMKAKQLLLLANGKKMLNDYPELGYAFSIASAELMISEKRLNDFTATERKDLISLLYKAMQQFRDIRNQYIVEEARARSIITSIEGIHAFIPSLFDYYIHSPGDDIFSLMLQLSEAHRGLILSEAIAQSEAYIIAGVPVHLQNEERQTKNELSRIRKKLDQELSRAMPKQAYIERLLSELIHHQNSLDKLITLFREKYPDYYGARFAHEIINVADIQETLEDHEIIIEYLIIANDVYSFVIGKKDKMVYKTSDINTIAGNALKFISLITQDNGSPARREQIAELGSVLYDALINPFEKLLHPESTLIIIPDRLFHYLPFEILYASEGNGNAGHQHMLIYQHPVQYQFSLTLWMDQLHHAPVRADHPLVIAPSFDFTGPYYVARQPLAKLNFAVKESNNIHQILQGKLLTNKKASKAGFVRRASESGLIHFATHAMADDRSGDFSWLAFSSSTPDSLLYVHEIYGLDLDAKMVVLSGCETGIGPYQNGEGLISLARAFNYAGAESMITSLWPVNDEATSLIMASFYTYLKEGHHKDKALQLAKLEYLRNISDPFQSDPYYWAGFIAIGDMTPLTFSSPMNKIWLVLLSMIAIAGTFFILRKKNVIRY